MESPRVTTDVVEIQDFPSLAQLYSVMGVPKTVINDSVQFTGAVTESAFLQRVLEAVGAAEPESGSRSRVSQQTTPIA
jgi:predicted DsbA family dithiol-disulfide isomerase